MNKDLPEALKGVFVKEAKEKYINELLKSSYCKERGSHEGGLQFHHKNPKTKLFEISAAINDPNISLLELKQEVAKCILICEGHHIKRTAIQRAIGLI